MLGEARAEHAKPTLLHIGGMLTAAVLATMALVAARPELAVLAALFAFDAFRRATTRVVINRTHPTLDRNNQLTSTLEIAGEGGLPDGINVRMAGVSGIPVEAVIAPEPHDELWGRSIVATDTCGRSGTLDLLRLESRVQSSRGAFGPLVLLPLRVFVPPRITPLPDRPRPRRLVGAWGPREDRRAGSGTRFFDVAPLGRGDRISRISWRTTARHATDEGLAELYVARTHAGAESIVMLVLDPRDDVGRNVDAWAGGVKRGATDITSLDIARNAAISLAHAHLEAGDRVGLVDLSNPGHGMLPATGRRAEQRLARYLTMARPPHRATHLVRPPRLTSAASVWLISTLLDDVPLDLAFTWSYAGHQVMVIDVLPDGLASKDSAVAAALELELAEREIRIRALRDAGVEVISWPWLGSPDVAAFLQAKKRGERR
ncbi:hypothetical protein BSZ39_03200 [Bowdeniella nasicola]|uniref:DUF58 domain-containing protein n=1 Tax=Bowdeniella nasicola TaxID=208480 RepID=A0A1Q5Q4J9_9ACTO|nr:DUF58 domain-containing protein [Bowdeniella nasicola]OKL54619.1 hypothetical protein BSZ39_03200 [Bowdeniella nasicola]